MGGHARLARPRGGARAPGRVLAIALAVAVVGLAADTQSEVISDVRELVPANLQELRDVNALEKETGVSGEIDVTVRARDITDARVIAWMTASSEACCGRTATAPASAARSPTTRPSCARRSRCPTCSRLGTTQAQVRRLLDSVPAYFSQGVITPDRTTANLAFGIRLMPLDQQKGSWTTSSGGSKPPPGVQASVVGLPVLAAEANAALSSPWRRGLTLLAALAGVFLVLFLVRRSVRRAAIPLIPIALASGWSGGIVFLLGLLPGPLEVDLNPMSVTLGALVIAVSTEFSVLLSARYQQERDARGGAGARDRADLRVDRRGGARVGGHRDRRLRRADRLGHPDAARLRHRHGGRPDRLAARRRAPPPSRRRR